MLLPLRDRIVPADLLFLDELFDLGVPCGRIGLIDRILTEGSWNPHSGLGHHELANGWVQNEPEE